ncbi:hypothetical protein SAMD00019534_019700 [Acytostelium subglobosum LB1]|uniref:hypothetical protein n=1 Tax=Acytostelium subglobosum LB1 TaxID=1410327 RepID=UPI000644E8D1|nr:hypothetical protein SAMD00019534_019700 [Acytostelium subglobosum LB1]GAM18795.1 hypothetical protein SAMD00019534_019700 [Acytostelium subglobosum LB1]|eukprot:XP_012758015.1 hypothetical protein SAMD00019534_019700 [Acytostelium subglobosum LB1]
MPWQGAAWLTNCHPLTHSPTLVPLHLKSNPWTQTTILDPPKYTQGTANWKLALRKLFAFPLGLSSSSNNNNASSSNNNSSSSGNFSSSGSRQLHSSAGASGSATTPISTPPLQPRLTHSASNLDNSAGATTNRSVSGTGAPPSSPSTTAAAPPTTKTTTFSPGDSNKQKRRRMGYYNNGEQRDSKQQSYHKPRHPDINRDSGSGDRRMDYKVETATEIENEAALTGSSSSRDLCDLIDDSKVSSICSILSEENWIAILQHLDHVSLLSLSETCYSFYRLANDKFIWQQLLKEERKKVLILPPNSDLTNPKLIYMNRRDYDTITEALAALSEGTRETMLIGPGLYKENIIIDKPVDIIGEGINTDVVIESASANTVSISAPYGSITNLSMRQTGHWFCIDIEKGGFTISKCDITNTTLSAVKIGRHATPWITDNIVHDCKEAGIAIFGGEGTIIGNRFTRNRYGSIEIVYSTAKPTIKLNRIYRNKGYGIHIHTSASAIITENIIEENESDGISCWGGATPTVSNNKICNNLEDGVYIHEDGKGVFEHNQIYGQKLDGIRISKSNPQINNNTIHHNQGDGIRLVIKANPIISENHICENKRVGIHIYREGMGIISNNYIYGNKNAGMQVYSRSNATICNNRIVQNRCSGIYVSDHAIVNIKSNEISNNGEVGVEIVSGSRALCFDNNIINRNWEAGLAYYSDSKPMGFEANNTFTNNGPHGNQQFILRQGRDITSIHAGNKNRTKSPDEMEPISFLVENALQVNQCTLSFTREYYHAQYWYECKTCTEPRKILGKSEIAVCEECAKKCHAGHDIGVRKYGHFYCDCGQQVVSPCKCISSDNFPEPMNSNTNITQSNHNHELVAINCKQFGPDDKSYKVK